MSRPAVTTLARSARSAGEIATELRREFETGMAERFGTQPMQDPVLATLFHAIAAQVARVYDEAEHVFPEAVLDDLVAGLGMPGRSAEPAQVVVGFTDVQERELLSPQVTLYGFGRTGESIPFTPDVPIQLSPTELAFAAVCEGGRVQVIPGARLADGGPLIPPVSAPLAGASPAPMLLLAFRTDALHLSGLSVFVDVHPADGPVAEGLRRSPWQLFGDHGRVRQDAVLRPAPSRGGVRRLEWPGSAQRATATELDRHLSLSTGIYGGQIWTFPEIPAGHRARCSPPAILALLLPQLLPAGCEDALSAPLAWVQVPLPAEAVGAAEAIQRVVVNCVTASNLEVFSERVLFDRTGTVVQVQPEGMRDRHVVDVLSVTGEHGERYLDERDGSSALLSHGRYRERGGRVELRPARGPGGRHDAFAVLRLLYCDGERANALQPGDLRRIGGSLANVTAQVCNLTVSRGGSAPPGYGSAKVRFAELLRTRERIVTAEDVDVVSRAFEPRVVGTRTQSRVILEGGAPLRVEEVTVEVRGSDFADPGAELVRLAERLEDHLRRRAVLGQEIRVRVRDLGRPRR